MGKRSNFERIERDFYKTPQKAVEPLIPFAKNATFFEPCAGDGQLSDFLVKFGLKCLGESDICPQVDRIETKNALEIKETDLNNAELIITNPPWDRKILHPIILNFRKLRPTWLLFDADWMFTKQAIPYLPHCSKIVSIGRVKWMPDSKYTGKDNACWYLFDENHTEGPKFFNGEVEQWEFV